MATPNRSLALLLGAVALSITQMSQFTLTHNDVGQISMSSLEQRGDGGGNDDKASDIKFGVGGAVSSLAKQYTTDLTQKNLTVTPNPVVQKPTLVLIGDICGSKVSLDASQKDNEVEWNCETCDSKTGKVTLTSNTLNAVKLSEEVFASLNSKCVTPVASDMDYDSRLASCLEKKTESSQISCLTSQLSKISFEKSSDGTPYASLNDFLDVLNDSLEPARSILEKLATSRDASKVRLEREANRNIQSAINKVAAQAKAFFQKNKRAETSDFSDATLQVRSMTDSLKKLNDVANYKQSENGLFEQAKDLNEKTQEMYEKYSALSDDSKKLTSAFIKNYESALNSGSTNPAYRQSLLLQAQGYLMNMGATGAGTSQVIETWAKLLESKSVLASDATKLKDEEYKPLLKQIDSADVKKAVNDGFNELTKAQNAIASTDPASLQTQDKINQSPVVTVPQVSFADLFGVRNDPKQGLAQQGGVSLVSSLQPGQQLAPADIPKLFEQLSPYSIGAAQLTATERAAAQGRPGTPGSTNLTAIPAVGSPALGAGPQ